MNKHLIGQVIGALPAIFSIVVGLMILSDNSFISRAMSSVAQGLIVGGVIGLAGVFLSGKNAILGASLFFAPGVSWIILADEPEPGLLCIVVALVAAFFVITHPKSTS